MPTVFVPILGAFELGVPPVPTVYQLSVQFVDAVALNVTELLFLHAAMFVLLEVGMLGIILIVSLAA